MLALGLTASLAGSGCLSATRLADPTLVVDAFRATLETYYEERRQRLEGEHEGDAPPRPVAVARARAGTRLIGALEAQGVEVRDNQARQGLAGLVPLVERFLHTRTHVAFARVEAPDAPGSAIAPSAASDAAHGGPAAPARDRASDHSNDLTPSLTTDANTYPGSFLLADDVGRESHRTIAPAGVEVTFHVVRFRRLLCAPYEVWRGEREGRSAGAGVWLVDDVAWVDLARLERAADALLYERAATLAAAGAHARTPTFATRPPREQASIVRDALRWRALERFHDETRTLPAEERRRRFALVRAEEIVEASILARALGARAEAAGAAAGAASALVGAEAALVVALDGASPLGALATIVALLARDDPLGARALARVLAALDPPAGTSDASPRALAALASIPADRLRAAARTLARGGAVDLLDAIIAATRP